MNQLSGKKRVLVAGGAGFIGSHLCEELLNRGCDVLCVDNFSTGSKTSITHLLGNPYFELLRHDVTFPLYCEVDEIYNLACPASPKHYQRDPVQTTKTIVVGSINLLGLAKRIGATILQSSTSEIYGDPTVHPQIEDYSGNVNPIGPRACYDEGKRCAETLFFDYHRQYGVNVKVARIFNTYGPRMLPDDGRVVSSFIVQALNNEPITIFGNGTQTRSFCFIDDMIKGLTQLMVSPATLAGPMNIGNPHEITVMELAQNIIAISRSSSQIEYHSLPKDDPARRCPDINFAQKMLNWEPTVRLDRGLEQTVSFFRQQLC